VLGCCIVSRLSDEPEPEPEPSAARRGQAGGFCVVRGSHKSNFVAPPRMLDLQAHQEHVHQPQTQAGDVILFSESTLHGMRARARPPVWRAAASRSC